MATIAPIQLDTDWFLIGESGFEYLVAPFGGAIVFAFGDEEPGETVVGYPLKEAVVLTPPGSENLYVRANVGVGLVIVTQGNAVA